jgi:hypothetical protein
VNRLLILGLTAVAAVLMSGATLAQSGGGDPRDLSGVWWGGKGPTSLKPADAAAVPLLTQAQPLYATKRTETLGIAAGPKSPSDLSRCLPLGVPRIWTHHFPIEIVQKPDLTVLIYEHNAVFRLVPMDVPMPSADDVDPAYMGHSVGHWDGSELVIDTAYFNDGTVLDDRGLPHSTNLRVTERLRKDANGKLLHIVVRIEDPDIYKQPWTTNLTLTRAAKGTTLQEYTCGWGEFTNRQTRAK